MTAPNHHSDNIPLEQKAPPTAAQSLRVLRSWRRVLFRSKVRVVQTHATAVALTATVVVISAHWAWARHTHNATDFARGGALVSLFTALLLATLATYTFDKGFQLDGGRVPEFHPLKPSFVVPVLAAVGTILWGYGDMVPWFKPDNPRPDAAAIVRNAIDARMMIPNHDGSP